LHFIVFYLSWVVSHSIVTGDIADYRLFSVFNYNLHFGAVRFLDAFCSSLLIVHTIICCVSLSVGTVASLAKIIKGFASI